MGDLVSSGGSHGALMRDAGFLAALRELTQKAVDLEARLTA